MSYYHLLYFWQLLLWYSRPLLAYFCGNLSGSRIFLLGNSLLGNWNRDGIRVSHKHRRRIRVNYGSWYSRYSRCHWHWIVLLKSPQIEHFQPFLDLLIPQGHRDIFLKHFLFHLIVIILGLSKLFLLGYFPLLHSLGEKLLKLNRFIVGRGRFLIELVTVHQHFVNVSLEFWHMMVVVSPDFLFNFF